MGYKGREIESKLIVTGYTYAAVVERLNLALVEFDPIIRIGSSVDTYWTVHDGRAEADFLRVRERDGIRQITTKGKDRGDNLNRIEIDIDSTSETHKIHRLIRTVLGRPAGTVCKTYQVWELESEYDTVCAYEVTTPRHVIDGIVVEVEARTEERMLELEKLVIQRFPLSGDICRAPGSLFEMCIQGRK